jgi:phospholipase A1
MIRSRVVMSLAVLSLTVVGISHAENSLVPVSTQSISAIDPSSATTMVVISTAAKPIVIELSALDVKANRERQWRDSGIRLLPFRPNYFLPYAQAVNGHPGGGIDDADAAKLQHIEAKFQFSFRAPLVSGLFFGHGTLQFAYTQLSLYQLYNRKLSAPFRSTNYEPEARLTFETPYRLLGWDFRYVELSYDHQSNGRSDPDSRSWNRIVGELIAGRGNGVISFRPWYRIPESAGQDDNPDIDRFLGHFELRGSYTWKSQIATVMMRNNLRARNKGAVEVDYNFPISRFGLGLSFSDWL